MTRPHAEAQAPAAAPVGGALGAVSEWLYGKLLVEDVAAAAREQRARARIERAARRVELVQIAWATALVVLAALACIAAATGAWWLLQVAMTR